MSHEKSEAECGPLETQRRRDSLRGWPDASRSHPLGTSSWFGIFGVGEHGVE